MFAKTARLFFLNAALVVVGLPAPAEETTSADAADKAAVTLGSHGPEADQSYRNIMWALSKMPRRFKACLWSNGYHIISVSSIDEWQAEHHASPYHAKDHPDWTYKNLSGLTGARLKQILVGQNALKRSVDRRVTFHECGHAFDNVRRISRSAAFISAYKSDLAVPKDTKMAWTSHGEICAQLVAVTLCQWGGVDVSDRPALSLKFAEAWPRCAEIVRNQLIFFR